MKCVPGDREPISHADAISLSGAKEIAREPTMSCLIGRAFAAASIAAFLLGAPAQAAQIAVASYDMPNGDGQASGGTFNYWDHNYTGLGAVGVDGAALTGGLGDLTDGVIPAADYHITEGAAGDGPWVGWRKTGDNAYNFPGTPDPTVTFHFEGAPTIHLIKIFMDNNSFYGGGIFAPSAILVDGVSQDFTPPDLGSIGWVNLAGLKLEGDVHTLQFVQNTTTLPGYGSWAFIGEVQFFGPAVPEPATWALLIAGFAMTGAALRRRRSRPDLGADAIP